MDFAWTISSRVGTLLNVVRDHTHYRAAVIGAGPAGLAVVATLLDTECTPILWIDPHFQAGRLSTYKEVPSNTKVKLFQQFVTISPSLVQFADKALSPFLGRDPDSGCPLSLAVEMVKTLTHGIRTVETARVHCKETHVEDLFFADGVWQVEGSTCERVYLATGSCPRTLLHDGIAALPLDDMLTPSHIPKLVAPSDTIGIVGSSHSAVLVLKNLCECEQRPQKLINFFRQPLLYASYMPDNWILFDNTGLKGVAADWARANLETGKLEREKLLERVCVKDMSIKEQEELWRKCTKLVDAVGYNRNPLPKISVNGRQLTKVEYDPHTGKIADGLFGFGIAFPEQTVDPYGNEEYAVGLWKFMRYARATIKM